MNEPRYGTYKDAKIEDLIGKTMAIVEMNEGQDIIRFVTTGGDVYMMYHQSDCCESVSVEDITGDLVDLIGSPILRAEESTSDEPQHGKPDNPDSFTWTFYKLATRKGYVDIRWLGESNGYYSEGVDLVLLNDKALAAVSD